MAKCKCGNEIGHTLEVTGPVEWSDQYVQCETEERDYRTVRNAGLVRQHRSLVELQAPHTTLEEAPQEPGTSSEGSAQAQEGSEMEG